MNSEIRTPEGSGESACYRAVTVFLWQVWHSYVTRPSRLLRKPFLVFTLTRDFDSEERRFWSRKSAARWANVAISRRRGTQATIVRMWSLLSVDQIRSKLSR
jgi:hypothetical protein